MQENLYESIHIIAIIYQSIQITAKNTLPISYVFIQYITRDHLNGLRQNFNLRNSRQLFARYPIVKSVNFHKFIRSRACSPGQCSAMTFIDASVKFLHIDKYNKYYKIKNRKYLPKVNGALKLKG